MYWYFFFFFLKTFSSSGHRADKLRTGIWLQGARKTLPQCNFMTSRLRVLVLEHGHVGHVVELHYFYKNPPYFLRKTFLVCECTCSNENQFKGSFARMLFNDALGKGCTRAWLNFFIGYCKCIIYAKELYFRYFTMVPKKVILTEFHILSLFFAIISP